MKQWSRPTMRASLIKHCCYVNAQLLCACMARLSKKSPWRTNYDSLSDSSHRRRLCSDCVLAHETRATSTGNKCLANAKRPCDCRVLCLRPKSSACSCPHSYFRHDVIWLRCGSMLVDATTAKPIFQVEGNIFHPIFFGYFIVDWLLYDFAAGSLHTMKLCSRLFDWSWILLKKLKIGLWAATLWGTYRSNVRTPSIAIWKARDRFPIRHKWIFSLSLTVETLQAEICQSGRFSKVWVNLRLNFRLKGYFSRQYRWTIR